MAEELISERMIRIAKDMLFFMDNPKKKKKFLEMQSRLANEVFLIEAHCDFCVGKFKSPAPYKTIEFCGKKFRFCGRICVTSFCERMRKYMGNILDRMADN